LAKQVGKGTVSQSDSETDSSIAQADAVRMGWLTGYSYNACESLYFKNVGIPDLLKWDKTPSEEQLTGLLRYLNTYLSLADGWKVDDEHKKLIESMIKNVEEIWILEHRDHPETVSELKSHKLVQVTLGQFEALNYSIEGIARATDPYAYYAMDFAGIANALDHEEKQKIPETIKDLKGSLSKLKKFVSGDAYSVLQNDIDQIERDVDSKKQNDDALEIDKCRTSDWSDLILGTRSVSDILTIEGKTDVRFWFVLIGVVIPLVAFSLGGFGLYYFIRWIVSVLKISMSSITLSNVKDFVSTVGTVVTIFTGLGLSLSMVVQKAWQDFESLESSLSVWFAKRSRFRNACQKTDFTDQKGHLARAKQKG
jgi:hypothetical protein